MDPVTVKVIGRLSGVLAAILDTQGILPRAAFAQLLRSQVDPEGKGEDATVSAVVNGIADGIEQPSPPHLTVILGGKPGPDVA